VKPFHKTAHVDITSSDVTFTHGTFSIPLPNRPSQIQQVSVRISGAPLGGLVLRNLIATIQLENVSVEHGIEVPTNPFVQSNFFAATLSRQVTFYADAGSVALFEADFMGAPHDTKGVDISIVGLTRSAGCSTIQ